jgi:hypothetical protein
MTDDAREDLILRHLDGETTLQESAQVTRLLGQDPDFRSRFFAFANLIADLQEIVSLGVSVGATPEGHPGGSHPPMSAMLAVKSPKVAAAPVEQPTRERRSSIDLRQIYFNAVLGGSGGLLGWLLITLVQTVFDLSKLNIFVQDALVGLVVGVCIGFAIGSVEGIIASRSLQRLLRGGAYGSVLGALGGVIGLVLGEAIFDVFAGGVWARAFGWAIFGAFVGTSDGFALKMPTKIYYGVLGGVLGGLIGGSTYQVLVVLRVSSDMAVALSWSSAIGLIILGACIGALVGLVESLLRKSWLFFITGRLEGQTRTLDSSRPHTLGSAVSCSIVLPRDPTVKPVHAEIVYENDGFGICPREGKVILRRDGRDTVVTTHAYLQPGDRIHLGDTRMVFRKEEKK